MPPFTETGRAGPREAWIGHSSIGNTPSTMQSSFLKRTMPSARAESDGEKDHVANSPAKRRRTVIEPGSSGHEEEEVVSFNQAGRNRESSSAMDFKSEAHTGTGAVLPFRSSSGHHAEDDIDQDVSLGHFTLRNLETYESNLNNNLPQEPYRSEMIDSFGDGVCVKVSPLQLPNSHFDGWKPPTNMVGEREAISLLEDLIPDDEEHKYIEMNDFTIYQPPGKRLSRDLCTLDRLQNKAADVLCFDGTLSVGEKSFYVRNVHFSTLTVDGYGELDIVDLSNRICIQSSNAQGNGLWYRLGKPAADYRRFYKPFLWLSTFVKFFADYLLEHADENVTLNHFRARFWEWIRKQYGTRPEFHKWHRECGSLTDFRTSVNAYISYLRKECFGIDDKEAWLLNHAVWGEVYPFELTAIQPQPNVHANTVVTPFVDDIFRRMYFAAHLEMQHPTAELAADIDVRKREMCLTPANPSPTKRPDTAGSLDPLAYADVATGDVVILAPDIETKWKSSGVQWFAYVQDLHVNEGNETIMDVLWLYETSDTTLGASYYPFRNELFLSDNCSCGKDGIPVATVLGKIDVRWFVTDPSAVHSNQFFVRHKFQTVAEEDKHDFVTLRATDFSCKCKEPVSAFEECQDIYRAGETVLVRPGHSDEFDVLEPARIIRFYKNEERIRVRMFSRAGSRPNELLETDLLRIVHPQHIIRKCHVGRFRTRNDVCSPYDRGGAGDFFYVLGNTENAASHAPYLLDEQRRGFLKGALAGLGMFCGGGNFDRGLEDGGAVKFKYAIDWAEHALHSYRANVENPDAVQFFLGSVNDYLAEALNGSPDIKIARLGNVQMISAGSPCPGFSILQSDKQSTSSLQFASMVASVVAFVDFYSPEYLILENVVTMTQPMGANKDQNVFAQILAALVALGYQVQQFLVDAWNQGSSQQRSRVFIIASAPGLKPFTAPPHTHGHPTDRAFYQKNLGKASNGLPFGVRRNDFTVYDHISARAATADLPDIADSMPQICPRFPDHRTPSDEGYASRQRIARIPTRPHGMGLAKTVHEGHIAAGEAYEFWVRMRAIKGNREMKSYTRVRPDGLFPTITTGLNITCAKVGVTLHWEQHRTLTVQEARRAQGFLDHEVIVGGPRQQWKIIGNSVDRNVSFSLGLALRESLMSETDDGDTDVDREIMVTDSREKSVVTDSADAWPETLRGTGSLQPTESQLARIHRESDDVKRQGFKEIWRLLGPRECSNGVSATNSPMRFGSETIEVNGLLTPAHKGK